MAFDSLEIHDQQGAALILPALKAAGLDETACARAVTAPGVYPNLAASDLAQMLVGAFSGDVAALRAALTATERYDSQAIAAAIQPFAPTPHPGTAGYVFDGATEMRLLLSNYDQVQYRDNGGSANSIVDFNGTNITFQAYIKPDSVVGTMTLATLRAQPYAAIINPGWLMDGTDIAWWIGLRDGVLHIERKCASMVDRTSTLVDIAASQPLAAGQWVRVTVCISNSALMTIWLDDRQVGQGSATGYIMDNSHWSFANDGRNGFVGEIQWFALWKGMMPSTQIAATPARLFTDDEVAGWQGQGLGGYWPLNSVVGNLVPDKTAIANTAMLLSDQPAVQPDPTGYAFDGSTYLYTRFNTQDRMNLMVNDRPGITLGITLYQMTTTGWTFETFLTPTDIEGTDTPLFVLQHVLRESREAPAWGIPPSDAIARFSLQKGKPHLQALWWNIADPQGAFWTFLDSPVALTPGQCVSVALTYSAGDVYSPHDWTIWLDGQAVATAKSPVWAGGDFRWLFGGDGVSGIKGVVGAFTLWQGPRNQAQLAASPKRRLTDVEIAAAVGEGLAGYWPLDNLAGGAAKELTPLANDGFLYRVLPQA